MNRLIASLVPVALLACHSASPPPPQPTKAAAPPTVPTSEGQPGSKDLAGLANLIPMLQDEATHRPTVAVTAEKLFDALTSAGLVVKQRKQVLAKSAQARFCALGKVDSSAGIVGVVVCEYDSEQKAATARITLDRSPLASNVARAQNGPTLVTVTNVADSSDHKNRIFDVLKSL